MTPRRSQVIGNIPPPFKNFEIQAYYQNEPRFNGVFSRDNLPNNSNNNNNNNNNIKNGAYVINLDEYHDIGTQWVALYENYMTATYFDSFGAEHIPKEIIKFIGNKNMITNIYSIQACDSIMCVYFLLDLSTLCLMVIAQQIILIFFHQTICKKR